MDENYDETLAFMNIVNILRNFSDFRSWLENYHKTKNHEIFFEGYKYLIIISIQWFLESIATMDPFRLNKDRIFERAHFVGIPINGIPNTCQKTIFCKNIWNLSKPIRKSKTWEELEKSNSLVEFDKLFQKIFDGFVNTTKLKNKDDSLRIISEANAYLSLNDTSHGRPLASLGSIFEGEKNPKYLQNAFEGYCFGLQYLWYRLLGKADFQNSCMKEFHNAKIIYQKDSQEFHDSLAHPEYDDDLNNNDDPDQKVRDEVFVKWFSLNYYHKRIWSEILQPIQQKLNLLIFDIDSGFFNVKQIPESELKQFLDIKNIEDADYINKSDLESIKKQLDCNFFWYPAGILDAAQGFEFNGAYAFSMMLEGYAQILDDKNTKHQILVRIIKHPAYKKNEYYYSFGILIEIGGLGDYSGWVIFFDCATDFSGHGGDLYDLCMKTIQKLRKKNQVTTDELIVNKRDFKEFLAKKTSSSIEHLNLNQIKKQTSEQISYIKGKLLEFVFHKWLRSNPKYIQTECDFWIGNEQIDCYGKISDQIDIFECKLQLHEDSSKIIQKLEKRSSIFKKEYPNIKTTLTLALYEDIESERKLEFESKNIKIINVKKIIQIDPMFNGSRREILSLFDLGFKDLEYY